MPDLLGTNPQKLKPGQPNQLWSFGNAVHLLNSPVDQNISQFLNEFLLLHRVLITNPDPLTTYESKETITKSTREISIHGILYTDITEQMVLDSEKLSKVLTFDQRHCLRIISQMSKRYPEPKQSEFKHAPKLKLPDDRESIAEDERLLLYGSLILRERRTILECSLELLSKKLDDSSSKTIQNIGKDLFLSPEYFVGTIKKLNEMVESLTNMDFGKDVSDEFFKLIYKESLLTVVSYLKILVELSINNAELTSDLILVWFKFIASNNFSLNLNPTIKDSESESVSLINSLATIVSISLLDLERNYFSEGAFLGDAKTFKELNQFIISPGNKNAIIMYSWSIILLRKFYSLEDDSDPAFTSVFSKEEIDESINSLTLRCKQLNVFHELDSINDIIKFDNLYSTILASLILAAMPLITLTPEIASTIANVLKSCPEFFIQNFFENEGTVNALIISRAKFPYNISPFLKLASINGNFALNEFKEMKSYMSVLPSAQLSSMSVIDDENTELIRLTKSIDINPPYELNNKLTLLLELGTRAKVLSDPHEKESLVAFIYKFSGLAFLGRVLQNLSVSFDPSDIEKINVTIDIFNLLTQILKDTDKQEGQYVLETMSAYIDGSDVIEIILRLLEQSLHSRIVSLSTSVCNLLYFLNPLASDRIWRYLSSSSLLSDGGNEGFVSTIFSSIEMINGNFDFTISFINLTEALAHDSLLLNAKHSIKTKSKVLSKCIDHLITVFESFIHCRFNHSFQKMEMGSLILDTFSNVLSMVYGLQNASSKSKVSEMFFESAKSVVGSFLIEKSNFSRTCYPLLSLIESLETELIEYELKDTTASLFKTWTSSVLKFSELIVSIRTSIGYEPSIFEKNLFKSVPILVKCYGSYEPLRKDILNLLTAITNGSWPADSRPSLLSHLGRNNTQILLSSIIVDLENDFDNYNIKVAIYGFISAVMSGDQEGLCVLLLGVRDIVNNLKENNGNQTKSEHSLIKALRGNVRNIEYLPDPVALHLVDSLVLVINNWSSINSTEEAKEEIELVEQFINKVKSPETQKPHTSDEYIDLCFKQKLKSKIFEILALYLFSTKNETLKSKISNFLVSDNSTSFHNSIFTIAPYHKTYYDLDAKFEEAFEFKLSDFRCSLVKRNRFSVSNVYNLIVMDGLFGQDPSWPEFRDKVVDHTVELQYLSVQIDVAKSLGALLTALCRKDPSVVTNNALKFCIHSLRANIDQGIPTELFSEIFDTRIQVCFYIVYTIFNNLELKKDSKITFELIKVASELLASDSMNFTKNLTESTGHYRSLLKVLYCCLSIVQNERELLVEYFSIIRDLFDLVVNRGTRILLIEIQNDVYLSKTNQDSSTSRTNERVEDVSLILSILKMFMDINISRNNQFELANIVKENLLIRSLLNLYSFSHLIQVDGDYVFAQLSLMFIQELMKNDIIAQDFIENGLFTVLQGSSISNAIKNGEVSITSSPKLHRIWTNGILPIFLFSLSNTGPSVLPEICFALTAFKKQIESCIDSWGKDSSSIKITTATVNETSQLLLVFCLLKKYNVESYFGINEDNIESNTVDVPVLPGLDSEAKREDFLDNVNNLLKHPNFLTSRIIASSVEEQRMIEAGGQSLDNFVKTLIEEISSLKDYLI